MNAIDSYFESLRSEVEDFKNSITQKLDELQQTLTTIQSQQSNNPTSQNHSTNMAITFDSDGAVIASCDGSLQFYGGVPRTSCAMFCGLGSPLNSAMETLDGPSIFVAEIRGIIMTLENLHFAGHNKAHLVLDSQVAHDVLIAIRDAPDNPSLDLVARYSDLTGELIRSLKDLLGKFSKVNTTKVLSHTARPSLMYWMNAQADFLCTSLLRDKYSH